MTAFFDTSVLLAAVWEDDQRHAASAKLINSGKPLQHATALHCLAEFYATITSLPPRLRVKPTEARQIVTGFQEQLRLVSLAEADYVAVVDQMAEAGIMGGAIYDALIARCAITCGASRLYTWNLAHFTRLGGRIATITVQPGS